MGFFAEPFVIKNVNVILNFWACLCKRKIFQLEHDLLQYLQNKMQAKSEQ